MHCLPPNLTSLNRSLINILLPPLNFTLLYSLLQLMAISKPHLLLIPYPLQGHIIPTVHLALKLATTGFSITFVNTEAVHHRLLSNAGHGDIFAGARAAGLDIRYELVSDGLPVSFDRSLYHDEFMAKVLDEFHGNVEVVARRLPALAGLIADTFFVWPATLAGALGIPYVSFWTEPALVFSLYYHMDLLRENGHFGSDENRKDTITYLPGVSAIEPADLMSYLQDSDTSTVVHQIIFKAFDEAHQADFILCNTVQELEPNTIAAMRKKKPFYSVGPIFPSASGITCSTVATSLWTESDCSQWLNTRPPGSVLYISFGSYAHVERKELEEIAHGVMLSRVSFVWVLRPDVVSSDEPDPLPAGFLEETAGRGIVVQWCCQMEVLANEAVGGFLTHCGWNSVLESVWNGVPMLCLPLLTDQFTNRKLVVGDWKVGEGFNGGRGGIRREEVGKKIEGLMRGKEGERMREEVKKVKKVLLAAVAVGGSSDRNFERFVDDLKGWGRKVGTRNGEGEVA